MKRLAIACPLLIIACIAPWVTSQADQPAAPTPPVPVLAEKVRVSDMPIVDVGIGTVAAYNVVDVRAQVTGTIEKVGFTEGQQVHPGSLIVQLDPRPFQAALEQAQATLARDQAHLANAEENLARFVPLEKRGFAAAQQVADQAAAVAQLRADIQSDNAAISNAQTQLSYTTITSPIDGVTGIRKIDIGNIVQPSNTSPIVTITQIQPISVLFTLPQDDLSDVQAAMAKGPLTTIAYSQDGTKKLDSGTLLLVNNTINPGSGTAQLKATFPNENRALWPGEFVTVRLILDIRHNSISVPLSALMLGQTAEQVFVVNPDNTVQPRAVTVAETLDGRALITQGLQPTDTVVTAGQYRLDAGTRIAIASPGDPHVQNVTPASEGMLQ